MATNTILIPGSVVVDSSAAIAWLTNEPGAEIVAQVFRDHPGRMHIHSINVCEVLYNIRRAQGAAGVSLAHRRLAILGVQEHRDMDTALINDVVVLKADIARVSLADCFLLALAHRLGGEVLTADRHELDRPDLLAFCPIHFIR